MKTYMQSIHCYKEKERHMTKSRHERGWGRKEMGGEGSAVVRKCMKTNQSLPESQCDG